MFGGLAREAWLTRRDDGRADGSSAVTTALSFGFGGVLGLGLAFVPFLIRGGADGIWFALYEYHAARDVGRLTTQVAYKAGFLARLTQAYPVAIGLMAVAVLGRLFRKGECGQNDDRPNGRPIAGMLWGSVLLVTLIHMTAPFPYDDYQVIIYPLFCVAVVQAVCAEVAARSGSDSARGWCTVSIVLLCLVATLGSPRLQGWFIGERDRIWWPLKSEPPLTQLRRVGKLISDMNDSGGVLLTQDVYLAVETGMRVPEGMELGPFCYYPDWSLEKAERLRVLNRDAMLRVLGSCDADVAAFSGYGFAIRAPEITPLAEPQQEKLWQAVAARYETETNVTHFGQASTTLRILRRHER